MAKASPDIMKAALIELQQSQQHKKQLREKYAQEKKVDMYLSPMYRPYFGNVMRVMLSGISIYFPVDGSTHKVPVSFASEIARRRMAIDNMLTKQRRMADISKNNESAPGELNLF